MKIHKSLFLFLLAISIFPRFIQAQTTVKEASVSVQGEVKTSLKLTFADIDKLEKTTVLATDRNNKEHTYSGVLLFVILKEAGLRWVKN